MIAPINQPTQKKTIKLLPQEKEGDRRFKGQSIPLPKVVIEVRYKDKTGQWNGANSLSINDLPKAILALLKAF
jgi:hypothetical protein